MKKNYIKPEITEVKMAANQAIASCAVSTGFTIEPLGYAYEGQAGSENSTFYRSPEALLSANIYQGWGMTEDQIRAKTFMNYAVRDENGGLVFFWEDKNGNGVWDGNSNGDNWQDVRNWNLAQNVINS